MQKFLRIIHLTDLHFGESWDDRNPLPGLEVQASEIAVKIVAAIESLQKSDPVSSTRVIVTGDLTTTGSEAAFRFALDFLRKDTKQGRSLRLSLGDDHALILPGNHDIWQDNRNDGLRKGSGRKSPYLDEAYRKVFEQSAPDADPILQPGASIFPYRVTLHQREPRIFYYALDSTRVDLLRESICGPDGVDPHRYHFWACGYVGTRQLQQLRDFVALEPSQEGVTLRIAGIHHPLAYEYTKPDMPEDVNTFKRGLLNLSPVQQELYGLGFSAVLCGHQHVEFHRLIRPSLEPSRLPVSNNRSPESLHILSAGSASQSQEALGSLHQRWGASVSTSLRDRVLDTFMLSRKQKLRRRQEARDAHCNKFSVYDFSWDQAHHAINMEILPHHYTPFKGPAVFRINDKGREIVPLT